MNNRLGLYFRNSLATYLGIFLLAALVPTSSGLRCYQCGQYTDGPGSITPCINYTDALHLRECPPETSKQCIETGQGMAASTGGGAGGQLQTCPDSGFCLRHVCYAHTWTAAIESLNAYPRGEAVMLSQDDSLSNYNRSVPYNCLTRTVAKYVNEASTVRDCADECNEKRSDSWGTSIYCCSEDACNSAPSDCGHFFAGVVVSAVALWNHFHLSARVSL